MSTTASDLCRVTVLTPTKFADLALPANVPVAELIGSMLDACDDDGLTGVPVVLQPTGRSPLRDDMTLAQAGLRDGETLHVRPRVSTAPEMVFDDLIDGVASVVMQRPDAWNARATDTLFRALAAASLAFGFGLMVMSGPRPTTAPVAASVSIALICVAAIASQIYRRGAVARVIALYAVVFGGLAGLAAPVWVNPPGPTGRVVVAGWMLSVDALLIGSVAVAIASLLVFFGIGGDPVAIVAFVTIGLGGVATGALIGFGSQSGTDAVAIVATMLVLLSPAMTSIAYRCAGLRPPDLPTSPDDLSSGMIAAIAGERLVERAERANHILTGLFVGSSAIVAMWVPLFGVESGTAPWLLTALIGAALLLRSRLLTGGVQRAAVIGGALSAIATLSWRLIEPVGAEDSLMVPAVACVAIAVACAVGSGALPKTRLSPYWGRAGDLAESMVALALLPVLFSYLGVYGVARAVGG